MVDTVTIGNQVEDLETADKSPPISKVIIWKDDESYFEAGDTSGYTIELTCPLIESQNQANRVLQLVSGFKYQPYSASSAIVDPASEIGDAVLFQGVMGAMYYRRTEFGGLMSADISAPYEEELEHEYEYVSSEDRRFTRENATRYEELRASIEINANGILAEAEARQDDVTDLYAALSITSQEIRAEVSEKVDSEGGTGATFGWSLTSSGFILYSDYSTVMQVDRNGLYIEGTIVADRGQIGEWLINDNESIYNGIPYNGNHSSDSTGMGTYGTDWAFWAGDGSFWVKQDGSMNCSSISVNNESWNPYSSNVFGNYESTLDNGLAGGFEALDVFSGSQYCEYLGTHSLEASYFNLAANYFWMQDTASPARTHRVTLGSIVDGNGANQYVLRWA